MIKYYHSRVIVNLCKIVSFSLASTWFPYFPVNVVNTQWLWKQQSSAVRERSVVIKKFHQSETVPFLLIVIRTVKIETFRGH